MKQPLFATLLILSSSLAVHAEGTDRSKAAVNAAKKQHEINGIVAGGVAGFAAGGAIYSLSEIHRIYSSSSQRLFEAPLTRGASMSADDIHKVVASVKPGDELRVTYATTQTEERAIRLKQLEERRISLKGSLARVQGQIAAAQRTNRPELAAALSNEVRDLSYVIDRGNSAMKELSAEKTAISGRVATVNIDTNKVKLADLETRMLNKLQDGKHILSVDRVSAADRVKTRHIRSTMKGQIAVMVFGGLISLHQLTYVPAIKTDDLHEGESLFVPILHPGDELM